ncbi:hypothetical protein C8046_08265 [Serinibacter arcticus]|uniref:Uncharacterized protein n=1 Tax=Serinibacter arcticus TaxID=1655435 RepID=A0A2U1ZUK2_9MICO|nr:hypothetical protein [Serinibacter arcticus]PWD50649.1 hypothetical protein C8046_08265 [Serinibacter arcticus]
MRRPAARTLTTLALASLVVGLAGCTPPQGEAADPEETSASPSPSQEQSEGGGETTRPTDEPETDASETDAPEGDGAGAEGADLPFDYVRGLPAGVEAPEDTAGGVGWNEAGDALLVITFGSSSCPLIPEAVRQADSVVEIDLVQTGGAVCTMDFVPTVTTVTGPSELDPLQAVTAQLGELGQVTIPNATTPPSIGWLAAG